MWRGPCWAAVSRGRWARPGFPQAGVRDSLLGRRRQPLQVGSTGGGGGGLRQGSTWVWTWPRLGGDGPRPPSGRSVTAFAAGLSLQRPLLAWRRALPHTGAASPRSSASRYVWIEKESINSVIISDSPEDAHQRLLVAASLSVNTTGE